MGTSLITCYIICDTFRILSSFTLNIFFLLLFILAQYYFHIITTPYYLSVIISLHTFKLFLISHITTLFNSTYSISFFPYSHVIIFNSNFFKFFSWFSCFLYTPLAVSHKQFTNLLLFHLNLILFYWPYCLILTLYS